MVEVELRQKDERMVRVVMVVDRMLDGLGRVSVGLLSDCSDAAMKMDSRGGPRGGGGDSPILFPIILLVLAFPVLLVSPSPPHFATTPRNPSSSDWTRERLEGGVVTDEWDWSA